jgi:hypothetical protein
MEDTGAFEYSSYSLRCEFITILEIFPGAACPYTLTVPGSNNIMSEVLPYIVVAQSPGKT